MSKPRLVILFVLALLIGFHSTLTTSAQCINQADSDNTVRVSFDRIVPGDPEDDGDSELVRLVLRNGTTSPISYAGRGVVAVNPFFSEAQTLLYDVCIVARLDYAHASARGVVPLGPSGCTWGIYRLGPGQSVRFDVPIRCLATGLAIIVTYSYLLGARGLCCGNPVVSASFSSYQLDSVLHPLAPQRPN